MRTIIAIAGGILVGLVAMFLISLAGSFVFPGPERIDGYRAEQIAAAFPTVSMGAKFAIILSWFGGALFGAAAARWIGRGRVAAWVVAGFFAIIVLMSVMILPMPGWLQAIAVAAPLVGGLIAAHLPGRQGGAAGTAGTRDASA